LWNDLPVIRSLINLYPWQTRLSCEAAFLSAFQSNISNDLNLKSGLMSQASSKTTTDHKKIKQWAEERGGKPCIVKGTADKNDEGGLLRLNFPGYAEDNLEEISWDKFFEIFDSRNLQFLYQEETSGGNESRFFKFISKEK
jgi:hypothetical protein